MYSKSHGAISVAVGVGLVVAGIEFVHPLVVVAYAAAVGVGIDFDHFVVARYRTGSWRAFRYLLSNPRRALADQSTIFREDDLNALDRLLSHVLIIGVAVPLTWVVSVDLGVTTAVVLYAHVLSDLLVDVRQFDVVRREPGL